VTRRRVVLIGTLVVVASVIFLVVQQRFTPATSAAESDEEQKNIEICMSHLRQIGIALNKYRQDHDGELPLALRDLYPKYASSEDIFFCPNDSTVEKYRDVVIPEAGRPLFSSYIYQHILGFEPGALQVGELKVPESKTFKELYAERGENLPIVVCVHHRGRIRPLQPELYIVLRLNGKVEKVFKYVESSEDL